MESPFFSPFTLSFPWLQSPNNIQPTNPWHHSFIHPPPARFSSANIKLTPALALNCFHVNTCDKIILIPTTPSLRTYGTVRIRTTVISTTFNLPIHLLPTSTSTSTSPSLYPTVPRLPHPISDPYPYLIIPEHGTVLPPSPVHTSNTNPTNFQTQPTSLSIYLPTYLPFHFHSSYQVPPPPQSPHLTKQLPT